jgi:hypothetical protein
MSPAVGRAGARAALSTLVAAVVPALVPALVFALVAGCDRSPSLATCADHVGGVWETADGADRWHLVDGGERLEGYPLVRELPAAGSDAIAAPSMLELRRAGREVAGAVRRRWQRGAETCVVRAPARIRGCAGDRLTLSLGDTGAPTDWTACRGPGGAARTLVLTRRWP